MYHSLANNASVPVLIILILVNIIILISYYSSRERIKVNRKNSEHELNKSKYIYKELEKDLKKLICEYYKQNFESKYIIKLQGIYSEIINTRKSSGMISAEIFEFIDKHEIVTKGVTKELKKDQEYEIIGVLHKGKVYVIGVREIDSNNPEFKTLENLTQLKRINEQKILRTIKYNESKKFWIPNIFFFTGSIFLIFAVLIEEINFQLFLIILISISMLTALLFILRKKEKVYSLKGILKRKEKSYFINDIRINDYENWLENFELGKIVEVEGIKQYLGEMALEIIKVQNYSLENKYKKFNKFKFLFYFLSSSIYFLFSIYISHYDTYTYYKEGLVKKATKIVLENYKEIKHNNFFVNQYVEFKNIKYLITYNFKKEIVLLNQDLKTNYSKKVIDKWEGEYKNISKIVDDYNKNNFEFTKDKQYDYFKKYRDYNRFLKNKSPFTVDFYNFLQMYFKDVNKQINIAKKKNLENLKEEIIIKQNDILKYSHFGFSQVFHSRGNKITLRALKLKENFYGESGTIKGYVKNITRKNGKLYLNLSKRNTIDKTLNYGLEAKKSDFLIVIYKIISIIFAIFFIREIFRIRYNKSN